MRRWQLAVDPDVRARDDGALALVHPVTGAEVVVPAAFVDVLPFAARAFTARELVERSGAVVSASALEHALADLRAAGFVVPASTTTERSARAAWNPLRLFMFPALGLTLLVMGALGVAVQLESVAFFGTAVAHGLRGTIVVPFLLAIVVVPAARAMFRSQVLGGAGRAAGARLKMRGVIPTWEVEAPPATTRLGKVYAHLSGFLFDVLLINACVLTLRSKPYELGYAGIDTPVAFLAVALGMAVIAANPVAKYDVYYALEEALGVADLRGHARARFFQLVTRRRVSPSTLAYALYFVAGGVYSLVISVGLLLIAYGVSSRLFPADQPLRLGLATVLVGVVIWRAVRGVHGPLVRALRARQRERAVARPGVKPDEVSVEIALPALAATLVPSLSPTEGFPFGFALHESVDDQTHDFAKLAPSVAVHVFGAAARGHETSSLAHVDAEARALDADAPVVRALSLRMFGQPPRALSSEERRIITVAHGLERRFPLDRYEPLPGLTIVDGTFKHGALDTAARLRAASELEVFRALFSSLRSRHIVARDQCALAFVDRADDRIHHVVLFDRNDDAGRAARLTGLARVIERGRPLGPERSATPLLDAVRAQARAGDDAIAARLRRTTPELLRASGCVPLLRPLDTTLITGAARTWALEAGFLFEETRAGVTRLGCQARHPTLIIPTGSEGRATGVKLRMLMPEPFAPGDRLLAPTARYEFLSPHRNFLGSDVDAPELPVWIGEGGQGDSVFVFDGELKAMACHHLLDLPALSTGGFNHPFAASLARHLAARGEASTTFVLDDEQPVYRRGRTDQLEDPVVRTLQLAWRVRALKPAARLFVMRGLAEAGKKLDLDEVAGLAAGPRDEALRRFRGGTADAVDLEALLAHAKVGPYVAALCTFSDRFYGVLNEMKGARVAGRSAEVRTLGAALLELSDQRKALLAMAGDARDVVVKTLRRRS